MKRLKLLLGMAALACAIGLTVKYGSAYRPVVGPVREIEEIWAIEDEREESEEPLVTRLFCNGAEAAYDAESNTFYCTLGLENGEEWPKIELTDRPKMWGGGLTLCFVDDYAYDACADAIRDGYAYQIMAYTDEAYSYSDVVFTGLARFSRCTRRRKYTTEDTPAALNLAFGNGERLEANARAHLRGNASLVRAGQRTASRWNLREPEDGKKKIPQNVPGLGQTDEIILLAMGFDPNMVRDRLSWSMIERIWPKDEAFAPVGREYVEVFVNDAYQGAYLMMVPFDRRAEIEKAGAGSAQRDSLYRSVIAAVDKGRPIDKGYELFIAPDAENPFAGLQTYLRLDDGEMDDETFCREAAAHIDVPSLMRYTLLVQGMALCDNIFNNMYVWAHETAAGVVVSLYPVGHGSVLGEGAGRILGLLDDRRAGLPGDRAGCERRARGAGRAMAADERGGLYDRRHPRGAGAVSARADRFRRVSAGCGALGQGAGRNGRFADRGGRGIPLRAALQADAGHRRNRGGIPVCGFRDGRGMFHAEHGGRAGGGMSGKTRTKNRKSV